jgi:hypothetical protein
MPRRFFTAPELRREVGQYHSVLAVFVEGDKAREATRGLAGRVCKLVALSECGCSEVTARDIETCIVEQLVPEAVFIGCERLTLNNTVDCTLEIGFADRGVWLSLVHAAARETGIRLVDRGYCPRTAPDREGWMRSCPQCGSMDTEVYPWILDQTAPARFKPGRSNPLL